MHPDLLHKVVLDRQAELRHQAIQDRLVRTAQCEAQPRVRPERTGLIQLFSRARLQLG